nr:hypothetical protein [Flammeovirgaceae bacterium]
SIEKNDEMLEKSLLRVVDVEQDPKEIINYRLKLVNIYINKKDYKAAHVQTKAALSKDKGNLDALYYNAVVNNLLGNYEVAKNNMESATSTISSSDPKVTAKLYYELGFAYHKLRQFNKSEVAFEKANFGPFKLLILKLTPGYYQNLANSYVKIYDFKAAIDMLNTALEIDLEHPDSNQLLAEISIKSEHHPEKAISLYKKAINGQDDPQKAVRLYDTVIELLLSSEKYDDAIKLADECLSKTINARNILLMKSMALHKKGKTEEGLIILEQLVKDANLTPLEIVTYNFSSGLMYGSVKEIEKAREAFRKSNKGPFGNVSQYELEKLPPPQKKVIAKD